MEKIEIEKQKLQKLLDYFNKVCSFCDELNIYEREEMDDKMQKMQSWVESNFE